MTCGDSNHSRVSKLLDVVLQVGTGRLVFASQLFGLALLFQAFVADELSGDFLDSAARVFTPRNAF